MQTTVLTGETIREPYQGWFQEIKLLKSLGLN